MKKEPLYKPWTVINGGLEPEDTIEDVKEEPLPQQPQVPTSGVIIIAIRGNEIVGAFTDSNLANQYAMNNVGVRLIVLPENGAINLNS